MYHFFYSPTPSWPLDRPTPARNRSPPIQSPRFVIENVPEMYLKCTRNAPKAYQDCTGSIPKTYQEHTGNAPPDILRHIVHIKAHSSSFPLFPCFPTPCIRSRATSPEPHRVSGFQEPHITQHPRARARVKVFSSSPGMTKNCHKKKGRLVSLPLHHFTCAYSTLVESKK